MKQLDIFKTEDDLFIEECENYILELEAEIERLEAEEKFLNENNAFDWAKEFPKLCDKKIFFFLIFNIIFGFNNGIIQNII